MTTPQKLSLTLLSKMAATIPGLRDGLKVLSDANPESTLSSDVRRAIERSIAWIEFLDADMHAGLPEPVPGDVLTKHELYDYLWRGRAEDGETMGGQFNSANAGAYKLWATVKDTPQYATAEKLYQLTLVNLKGMATLFYES